MVDVSALCIFAVTTLILVNVIAAADNVIVNTTFGPLAGIQKNALGKSVNVFYGIPFAKPPVGHLRFKRPLPVDPWNPDVQNATVPKPSCLQTLRLRRKPLTIIPPEMDEDCLYLNVFAPVSFNQSKKAVMVYIFGGIFKVGSINSPMYDGRFLASVNDVIIVTISYRLGVLGFLYLDAETVPGNMGLLDQQLGLKWVYENIQYFGGDPTRITLFGQSAGAGSVSHHLLSPLSHPYFTSAVMQSGSPLTAWDLLTNKASHTNAVAIANKAKCSNIQSNVEIYECLNAKSGELLVKLQDQVVAGANVAFGPVVDGYFLPERPLAILEKKRMKNCSILLGVNENEGSLFLYYGYPSVFQYKNNISITDAQFLEDLNSQARKQGGGTLTVNALHQEYVLSRVKSERNYVQIADQILGDFLFKCPATRFAGFYSKMSGTYLYSYGHRPSTTPDPAWMGVIHSAELPLVWGHALDPTLTYTEHEKTLSTQLMKYWTNFAKYGSPNGVDHDLPTWPRFDNDNELYLKLGSATPTVGSGLRRRQCVFLYQTVPLIASLEKAGKVPPVNHTCTPSKRTATGGAGLPTDTMNLILALTLVVWIVGARD